MTPREQELEDEVERLKSVIDSLTGRDAATQLQALLGLRPTGARILACLLMANDMGKSREALYAFALEHANGDGPEIKTLDVHVSYLRTSLRTAGAVGEIEAIWGRGYRLSTDLRNWLQAKMRPGMAVAA